MRRSIIVTGLITTFCVSATFAQQARRTRLDRPVEVNRAQVNPDLWRVLENWSRKSAGIKRLEGRIVRRTYDFTFSVERLAEGYIYYESPDKGRLDLAPAEITKAMLQQRQAKGARVQRNKKTGEPFELAADHEMKWICDGKRVTMMEVDETRANIMTLRPEERGKQIMNGPLPFLFALPPQQAVDRFHLTLTRPATPGNPIAILEATPRLPRDSQAWKAAKVMLDTQTGLPVHVQLTKPSGTAKEVYSFGELKVNSPLSSGFRGLIGENPFNPKIPRGWIVKIAGPEGETPAEQKGNIRADHAVPDLVGMSDKQAVAALFRLGIPAERIKKYKGEAARTRADEHRVRRQKPQAGAPITKATEIALEYWTVKKLR